MLPALDVLKEYLGLMQDFPDLVEVHRGAMRKVRDADKMKEEGRIDIVDADQVTTRSDTVSNVVLAEIYHFQHERVVDFRDLFKSLLGAKIQFYKEIVHKLEMAQGHFNDGTDL
jgi:sorting nexin-9/18/33